jgi:nanoRNase/pAp phosphatase (c-di-AMP/oligoRNAs hydrolase)
LNARRSIKEEEKEDLRNESSSKY